MMQYVEPENGKIALIQEILDINDMQDIVLLYKFRQEFLKVQDSMANREENTDLS